MSKKKKKSKNYEKILYENHGKKSGKKKKDTFNHSKSNKVDSTLTKKERKYMKKKVNEDVKVPEEFVKTRARCNHSADRITVAEFRQENRSANAYTPMIDAMIHVFGEDRVRICTNCYEAVLVPEMIPTPEDIEKCMTIMYAACSAMKMNTDKVNEVLAISKMQERLDKFAKVLPMLEKTLKRRDKAASADAPSGASLNDLNRNFIG